MIVTVEQTIDDATGHNQDEEEDACDNNGGLWWNEGGQTTKWSHATSTDPTNTSGWPKAQLIMTFNISHLAHNETWHHQLLERLSV